MTTAGFPNMLFMYGPQAPTAFGNGTIIGKIQSEWISTFLMRLMNEGKTERGRREAVVDWKQKV
jgi:hypothetical protein